MALLTVENLSMEFGGIRAVDDVSFRVGEGEIFTIIGPNGAGKTTIFNMISLIYRSSSGRIRFDGNDLSARKPQDLTHLGLARTFQNIELFEHETLLQNLLVGRHCHARTRLWQEMLFTPATRRAEIQHREAVEQVIDLLNLQHYRDSVVGNLPYGVQKLIELGRALCARPRLLLLDEPSSGLNVEETDDLSFWIEDIRNLLGITVVMIEHDMRLVSQVSDRVLAVSNGRVLAEGTAREIQDNPAVAEAYLGTREDVA
ncbi:ABC transporter ATP-binding protein [Marinobacter sp.]|uniref:ABC transporter ATP-binding protein n=1 Tax=Marinobacter sp. TaxID=50741 RepID=UPI003566268C